MNRWLQASMGVLLWLTASAAAQAQETTAQPVAAGGGVDGVRFRGGAAFTGGVELVPDANFTAVMFGVDGRLGVQINHLVGAYLATHLSFGSGEVGFGSGLTGTFAFLAMADFTFNDLFFAGAGFGYTIFNNPGGVSLGFRAGVYPVKSVSSHKARRRGLMLSLESRIVFLGDPYGAGFQVMGAIGYEAF